MTSAQVVVQCFNSQCHQQSFLTLLSLDDPTSSSFEAKERNKVDNTGQL